MLNERQQRLSQGEIKNNRLKLKGFGVISKLPQAFGLEHSATEEIIQLMVLFDSGVWGFWLESPWRSDVILAQRLINILHVNERDVVARSFVLDAEHCEIMSPLC